jgi:hypothetical protein
LNSFSLGKVKSDYQDDIDDNRLKVFKLINFEMEGKLQAKPSYANKERSISVIFFLGEHPKKKYDKCYPKNPQENSLQQQIYLKTA